MCICLGGTIRTRILGSEDIVIILGFDALSGVLGGQCNDYWAYYRLGMVAIQTMITLVKIIYYNTVNMLDHSGKSPKNGPILIPLISLNFLPFFRLIDHNLDARVFLVFEFFKHFMCP